MTDLSLPPGIASRFTAKALLHRGRMGAAYRARSSSGAEGVLRLLEPSLSRAATDRMRLARGLDKLMTVIHPNLAVPTEHGEDGGQLWYFRPYIEGSSLAERLAQGPLALDQALGIGGQVADALHALHRAGLLHRDLCPERIVLQPDGRAVLLDATMAAPVDVEHERIFGTASFVSPEEVEGKPTSFRSDLYALGSILYATLSGEAPFEGPIREVLRAHVSTPVPALSVELTSDVRALLDQLLDKEPRRRPFSAQKVSKALLAYVPPELRVAETPLGAPTGARPPGAAAPVAAAPVVAAPAPTVSAAATRPAAPPARSPKATLLGVAAPAQAAAAPSAPRQSAPPPPPNPAKRQASMPPPPPPGATGGRQPSMPPPPPPAAMTGRSAKRTMVGMPAPNLPRPEPTGYRDDATQQIQLEQIVEAHELRGKAAGATATPAKRTLGTSNAAPRRDDSTQQVQLEQIVEVRSSRLPPAPPGQPSLDTTASDLPLPAPDATGFEEEPTSMFDGHLGPSAPIAAAGATATAAAQAAAGFDDEEPTRMFDGGLGGYDPPTTEMELPPVEEPSAGSPTSASDDAEDEPTSMFSASELGPRPASEPPPSGGLDAPIIAPNLAPNVMSPTSAEPATAPLGSMGTAPPARVSSPGVTAPIAPPPRLSAPALAPAVAKGAASTTKASSPKSSAAANPEPAAVAPSPKAEAPVELPPVVTRPMSQPPSEGVNWKLVSLTLAGLLVLVIVVGGGWALSHRSTAGTSANPPAALEGGGDGTLTAPVLLPDAGTLAVLNPDLGAPDLGQPDLGAPDLGAPDLGAPDLGAPDLGMPDLGPPDEGVVDEDAFANGPMPRGRAERARWRAARREAASRMASSSMTTSSMATTTPGAVDNSASGVQARARAATASGNHAEATRLYEQLTRMSPSNAGAWYSLGASRMRERNGRGAVAALERATRLSPRNANYWVTLGNARRNSGDAAGARAAFQQALRFDPNNAAAQRGLGQ